MFVSILGVHLFLVPALNTYEGRIMVGKREDREKELQSILATDCIRLVRIYQNAIGTPNGQIPIPGIPPSRMIDVILKKEFAALIT